jgi:hypothetical protein
VASSWIEIVEPITKIARLVPRLSRTLPVEITRKALVGRSSVHLNWVKGTGDTWCSLDYLNLSRVKVHGVYIIWKAGSQPRVSTVIRVGRGDIATRLDEERSDPKVSRHGPGLLVTWAEVDILYSGGVEVYLAQQLRPHVGERFPLSPAVEVNLPVSA